MTRPRIEADLRLTVTAPDGRATTARAVGSGSTLRVETTDPDVLLAAINRADVGPLADGLDAAGVSVSLDGPSGRVALIGSAASSRMGRILTGSANTQVPLRLVLLRAARPATAAVVLAGLLALWIRSTRNRRTLRRIRRAGHKVVMADAPPRRVDSVLLLRVTARDDPLRALSCDRRDVIEVRVVVQNGHTV